MMKKLNLGLDYFQVSEFSFGTASLARVGGLEKQNEFLRAARDIGFSHYDTSPYYGFGLSEIALGQAFGNNSKITIASKVGIYPPKSLSNTPSYCEVIARKSVGKFFKGLKSPYVSYDFNEASRSLTRTLKRLKRTYLDILYIHEPKFGDFSLIELGSWMKLESRRVKHFGFAGELSCFEEGPPPDFYKNFILQTRISQKKDLNDKTFETLSENIKFVYGLNSSLGQGEEISSAIGRVRNFKNQPGMIISTSNLSRLGFYQSV